MELPVKKKFNRLLFSRFLIFAEFAEMLKKINVKGMLKKKDFHLSSCPLTEEILLFLSNRLKTLTVFLKDPPYIFDKFLNSPLNNLRKYVLYIIKRKK